jgi:hypothetical protein
MVLPAWQGFLACLGLRVGQFQDRGTKRVNHKDPKAHEDLVRFIRELRVFCVESLCGGVCGWRRALAFFRGICGVGLDRDFHLGTLFESHLLAVLIF